MFARHLHVSFAAPHVCPAIPMFTRQFIDSLDFAYKGKELRGEVAAAEMPRLQDMLAAPAACPEHGRRGKIAYVLRGLPGRDGRHMLEVALEGSCQLRCQRCLQEFTYPIKLVTRLILVPGDELDELSVDEDEIDSIPADQNLDVLALLEEELLLNLPFAPKHPEGACQSAVGYGVKTSDRVEKNPFAVLADLKIK